MNGKPLLIQKDAPRIPARAESVFPNKGYMTTGDRELLQKSFSVFAKKNNNGKMRSRTVNMVKLKTI
jgi:hypothetical protein